MPDLPHFDVPGVDGIGNDDWDDENNDDIYLKYMFEGAASIANLSASLRGLADQLDAQAAAGWRLAGPVDSGWAHLTREDVQ